MLSRHQILITRWKVFKVEGFRPGTQRTEGEKYSALGTDDYPLLRLEEDPNVRVLQEHRQDGKQ